MAQIVDTLAPYAAVGAGAVLGANLRYVLVNACAERFGTAFPYGTLVVNVTGAFVIGVFLPFVAVRFGDSHLWRLFFATGLLGGYTTFSSYAWDALLLAEHGAVLRAFVYVGGSNVLGLLGVWVGATIARAIL